MKRLFQKLRNRQGITLVEMIAAVGVLALLSLMLHTGLSLSWNSYYTMTSESETQLLLSTLSNLLSNELRYARDVVTQDDGTLERYTSVSFGRNTTLSLNSEGQLEANERQMLSTGAYGNGNCQIEHYQITLQDTGVFQVDLRVTGRYEVSCETTFFIRCLNAGQTEGGST